jgi:hypothetical protein
VTAVLYDRYPTLESLASADLEDLCTIIKPCGLFRTKANDIKNASIEEMVLVSPDCFCVPPLNVRNISGSIVI